MNPNLQKALEELQSAGAQGLPEQSAVESAQDGMAWSGQKSNGEPWSLTRNNEDSYNCAC